MGTVPKYIIDNRRTEAKSIPYTHAYTQAYTQVPSLQYKGRDSTNFMDSDFTVSKILRS